ncbi:MAG TPA: branched-chain amino acid ABC transporter permease [Actinomycetota bacterium]|nr:branched-chain amino acid ABC transporter permease [Actinomycetota bacterium]
MDWDKLVQLLVNGVTLGSVYALVALGFSMVYGILKLLNLAHGDVLMVGAFIGWGVLGWLGGAQDPTVAVWLVILLMVLAAMVGGGFLGVAIERFAYRPLRRAPRIAPLISALGVSFFIQNSVLLLFGANFRSYDSFDLVDVGVGVEWGPLHLWVMRIFVIASAVAMMAGLWLLVTRSKLGKAMRATAFDREAAAMMGIDVDRVIVKTFFIGSALAGAAGVLVGLVFFQINHFMGFNYGLKGFTAAVVGGIGSIPGAMVGGLVIGLAEAFSVGYIEDFTRGRLGSAFSDLIVFLILVVFMLVRPQGIFGKPEVKKV